MATNYFEGIDASGKILDVATIDRSKLRYDLEKVKADILAELDKRCVRKGVRLLDLGSPDYDTTDYVGHALDRITGEKNLLIKCKIILYS